MGCFWSSQASREKCMRCRRRRGATNLRIVDNICEICINQATRNEAIAPTRRHSPKPFTQVQGSSSYCYGEYRCSCGRTWDSRKCWPGWYQICDKCGKQVYAHTQRDIRPSDFRDEKKNYEHKKELCQKCLQLGTDCGSFQAKSNIVQTRSSSRPRTTSERTRRNQSRSRTPSKTRSYEKW